MREEFRVVALNILFREKSKKDVPLSVPKSDLSRSDANIINQYTSADDFEVP